MYILSYDIINKTGFPPTADEITTTVVEPAPVPVKALSSLSSGVPDFETHFLVFLSSIYPSLHLHLPNGLLLIVFNSLQSPPFSQLSSQVLHLVFLPEVPKQVKQDS